MGPIFEESTIPSREMSFSMLPYLSSGGKVRHRLLQAFSFSSHPCSQAAVHPVITSALELWWSYPHPAGHLRLANLLPVSHPTL